MDSFTLNKIAGAVLGTCLVGMGIGIVAQSIYEPAKPAKPGYALPEPKEAAGGGAGEKTPGVAPIAVRLEKADPKRGEADAKVCSACHNFQEGAGAKVGPDLWDVVDRKKGSAAGFDYSAGLKGKGGDWTYADLDAFITKPSAYVQGTKMGYPGQEDPEKRADIIAYLHTLSKAPKPLPKVSEADKKQAAAGGEAKSGPKSEAKSGQAEGAGEAKGGEKGGGEAAGDPAFLKLVGEADPKKGQSAAQVCGACHSLKKGGGTLVGPDLWNVVDRKKGSVAGYDYSAGLKAKGGEWTFADLNAWLTKPSAYVSGTKMGYPGEANEKKRAEIIAYLRTLSDSPVALPGADQGAKKGDETKADEKKAEGKPLPPAAKPADQKPPAPPAAAPQKPEPASGTEAPKAPQKPKAETPAPKSEAAPEPKPDAAKPNAVKPEAPKPEAPKPAEAPKSEAPTPDAAPASGNEGPEPYKAADPQYPSEAK